MLTESRKMIPIAKPYFDENESQAVLRTIASGWITQGPEVAAFENEFAQFVQSDYAVAVSNCTTALHLALLAVGVSLGDEVITVSHSFIATANAIRHCGAVPIFIDIDPNTFNMDPELLEAAITPKTKAILAVHQIGMPCDLEKILKIAERHQLPVIEDAACAIGSEIKINNQWQPIGKPHAEIACFSFHPRKVISTGDGGMLTTCNEAFDHQFRLWRQHGMSISDKIRHQSNTVIFEEYPIVGYNYRLTDLQASLGRAQLKKIDHIIERRRSLATLYHYLLLDIPEVTPPLEPDFARSNWQSYAIRLKNTLNTRTIMQYMLDMGVATRRGVMCIHREKSYADLPLKFALPISEKAQDTVILLPIYPQLQEEDILHIIHVLKKAIVQHG